MKLSTWLEKLRGEGDEGRASELHLRWTNQRYDGSKGKDWLKEVPRAVGYLTLPQYLGDRHVPAPRRLARKFGGERVLPDFACIGAPKSGTTDIASYLSSGHPSLLLPLVKEPLSPFPEEWRDFYPTAREMADVKAKTGQARVGYFAPAMHDLLMADNYKDAVPDAKVVLLLRDPVDRAFSQYKWERLVGGRPELEARYAASYADYFGNALDYFPIPAPGSYFNRHLTVLQMGIYVQAVEHWLKRFGKDNVLIVAAEDYFADIPAVVCQIQEFLGLDPIKPELHKVLNQNSRKFAGEDPETKQRLIDFYRPWNEQLYTLLDRDFGWQ